MAATKKKGLGTGLGALLGEDISSPQNIDKSNKLPISNIEPRASQPRKKFNDDTINDLAESIEKYGLLQPITVRKESNGFYEIIAGERRWRAAKIAGLTEVPVNIIEADDKLTAELALVENLQREDLNPVEEAMGYKSLMEDYNMTQEDVSASVGKSRPAIANSLRLLNLSQQVLDLLESGKISSGHARALVSIPSSEDQYDAAMKIINKGLSVRKAEQLSASYQKHNMVITNNRINDINYAEVESINLTKALSRKCKIIQGKRTGKIELEYYNDNDREELIKSLYKLSEYWNK